MLLAVLAITVMLPVQGAVSPDRAAPDTIPEPVRITTKEAPSALIRPPQGPAATDTTDAALYYLVFDGRGGMFRAEDDPATILRALIRRGFALEDAWFPISSSVEVACMAPNVYLALVVRLRAPDAQITALDFTDTPSPAYPNCGVEAFQYYNFD